jgi:hypothetical protein
MTTKRIGLLIGALILILLAGCQPIPLPTNTAAPADVPSVTPPPVEEPPMNESPSPTPPIEPGAEPLIRLAVADLAQRLGIPAGEIAVIEARAVVWPDASIGCPEPDMRYIQVPEDGAFIQLSAGGRLYNYHNGGRRGLFLCEQVGKSGAPPSFDELQLPGGGGEDL